jgi:hypothetical protein
MRLPRPSPELILIERRQPQQRQHHFVYFFPVVFHQRARPHTIIAPPKSRPVSASRSFSTPHCHATGTIEELLIMLRNLIEERFRLQMHSEAKKRPVYVLSVNKTGVKMKPHEIGSAGDPRIDRPGGGKLAAKFTSMDYFAFG